MPRFKPLTMSASRGRQPPASRPREQLRQSRGHEVSSNHEVAMPLYSEYQVENHIPLDSFMAPMDSEMLRPLAVRSLASPFMSPLPIATADASAGDTPGLAAFLPAGRLSGSLRTDGPGATAEGTHSDIEAETGDEMAHPCDARKYLMKRRRSMSRDRRAGRVLRRVKSALLPLEIIPVGQEMHAVSLGITTSHCELHQAVLALMHVDNYVSTGISRFGLPDNLDAAADIQNRIQSAFGEWTQRTIGAWHDLKLNFLGQMKGKYNEQMCGS